MEPALLKISLLVSILTVLIKLIELYWKWQDRPRDKVKTPTAKKQPGKPKNKPRRP